MTKFADITSNALDWKFRDMPEGVRNRWVSWAETHYWCDEAYFDTDGDLVIATFGKGEYPFKTPRELKTWAGY